MELTNGETFWKKHFSADEMCKLFCWYIYIYNIKTQDWFTS